jgi:P4 family phage/plasmid primase-like protien
LVELVQDVLGDYATTADTETVLAKRHQGVGNDVAALKGARFVSAAEVEQDRRLAESKVKSLTGNDTVTARFLYSEPFTFKPEFKLWLSTNNKPVIRGTDDAIWDRIRLIPFEQRFVGDRRDPKLPEKLREESSGVLAWMVRGCAEWRREGLGEPERVRAATEVYRAEQDTLAAFIEECCTVHPRASAGATPLYNAYRGWCEEGGEARLTQTKFGLQLKERSFSSEKAQRVTWHGIGLRDDRPDPDRPGQGSQDDDLDSSDPNQAGGGNPKSAEEASNRLNGDGSDPNRLNGESRIGMTNIDATSRGLDSCRPLGEENRANQPHEEKLLEKGLQPSNRLKAAPVTPREDQPTPEQEERIRDLRSRGWSEWSARCEVLAKNHEIGCECEVCG